MTATPHSSSSPLITFKGQPCNSKFLFQLVKFSIKYNFAIKLAHISDAAKRVNIQNELDALLPLVAVMSLLLNRCRA